MPHSFPVKRILLFLLAIALAPRLVAQCTVQLRYESGQLRWNAVPGASGYQIQESTDDLATSRNFFVRGSVTSFAVNHRASRPMKMKYRVVAPYLASVQAAGFVTPSFDACTGELEIELPADPDFRALTRRAIVPVVGSTPGAQGSRFKTSLRLIATAGNQRGRIVFHPAGRSAAPSDPSLPYRFNVTNESLAIDDVVAELGQSGLGSLDVVPDDDTEGTLPRIEARLFNDTDLGTFGSFAPVVFPYDYLRPAGTVIDVPDARFRLNLGIRTLTATNVQVLIHGRDGRLRLFKDLSFPAEYVTLTAAAQFLGTTIAAGDSLTLIPNGSAIVFHTVTENRTNDPTLVVAPARGTPNNVGGYID